MEIKTSSSSYIEEKLSTKPDIIISGGGTEYYVFEVKTAQKVSKVEDIYPEIQSSSILGTILNLLDKSLETIQLAKRELEQGNEVYSDVYVLEFQGLLDELFCNREVGDGFGMVINSLLSLFENLDGNFLNIIQITTIYRILHVIRAKPFLSESEAIELTQYLEDSELEIEPKGFNNLVDFLTDEELH